MMSVAEMQMLRRICGGYTRLDNICYKCIREKVGAGADAHKKKQGTGPLLSLEECH